MRHLSPANSDTFPDAVVGFERDYVPRHYRYTVKTDADAHALIKKRARAAGLTEQQYVQRCFDQILDADDATFAASTAGQSERAADIERAKAAKRLGLSAGEHAVFCLLRSFAGDEGLVAMGHAEIAKRTGGNPATVGTVTQRLKLKGLIEIVEPYFGRRPATYRVLEPGA